MPRFFVEPEAICKGHATVTGGDAYHIARSLRMAVGDEITLADGSGKEYICRLTKIRDEECCAEILTEQASTCESPAEITLYMAYPKSDKLELIIQKCTELGVSQVIPVETSRSVVHLDGNKAGKKLERWQKIAQEASQQSKRVQVPTVGPYYNWKQMLKALEQAEGLTIVFWEDEQTQSLKALLRSQMAKPQRINLIVGPEGGLSEDEVAQLRDLGAVSASLGKRILRTETAGMAGISMIMYEFDELE
jgi:16S rRNA (uracil1498-N3)-methyltransferase